MVIIKMWGGLGNQLFIYTFARNLEKTKNIKNIYFEISNFEKDLFKRKYLLDLFKVKKYPTINNEKLEKILTSKKIKYFIHRFFIFKETRFLLLVEGENGNTKKKFDKIQPKKNYYIKGYFQDTKIFQSIAPRLVKEIFPIKDFSEDTKKILQEIKKSHSVSVHIRQKWNYDANGNLTNIQHSQLALLKEYYIKKMKFLYSQHKNLSFFIMGDDINWAKKNLPNIAECKYHYIDNKRNAPDYEDLFLIAHCKFHIPSNSSFCKLGIWLSNYYK